MVSHRPSLSAAVAGILALIVSASALVASVLQRRLDTQILIGGRVICLSRLAAGELS
jgi:hypothetical protein